MTLLAFRALRFQDGIIQRSLKNSPPYYEPMAAWIKPARRPMRNARTAVRAG